MGHALHEMNLDIMCGIRRQLPSRTCDPIVVPAALRPIRKNDVAKLVPRTSAPGEHAHRAATLRGVGAPNVIHRPAYCDSVEAIVGQDLVQRIGETSPARA